MVTEHRLPVTRACRVAGEGCRGTRRAQPSRRLQSTEVLPRHDCILERLARPVRGQAAEFKQGSLLESQLTVTALKVRSDAAGMTSAQPSCHFFKVLQRNALVEPDGPRMIRPIVDEAVTGRCAHLRRLLVLPILSSQQLHFPLVATRGHHHPDVIWRSLSQFFQPVVGRTEVANPAFT